MIQREVATVRAAILAGVTISTENFSLAQPHAGSRPFDHVAEPDDRRARIVLANGVNEPASVEQQFRLAFEDEADSTAGRANIQRLEIRVQEKNRFVNRMHYAESTLISLCPSRKIETGPTKRSLRGSRAGIISPGKNEHLGSADHNRGLNKALADLRAHIIQNCDCDCDQPYCDAGRPVIQQTDPLNEQEANSAAAY